MENVKHWTQRSTADFVHNISSDFVGQLETRMEEKGISRGDLARRLNKTNGRVSQVLNNPGNIGLRVSVDYARALGMKVSLVAYDDGDSKNEAGPINPDVFVKCWERCNQPKDLFEVVDANSYCINVIAAGWEPARMQWSAGYFIGYAHATLDESAKQIAWNSASCGFKTLHGQSMISEIPTVPEQTFSDKTGDVYATQKAISAQCA